jgi:hypothetical protein
MQIKLLMISFKKIFYNLFVIIILLFFTDFIFGKYIFNYLNKKNIEQLFLLSKKYDSTESHPVYNHTFKKNYSGKDSYGQFEFYTCTNNYGFRVGCDNKKDNIKNFDFAIIGDSYTESLGLNYEDSWINLLEKKLPQINIINLGVRSYSPSISYVKIKELLNEGFNFKEIFVYIDIGDVENEFLDYRLVDDNKVVNNFVSLQERQNVININTLNYGKNEYLLRYKKFFKENFRFIYAGMFEIRYWYLPKPTYRYYPKYQTSSWTFNKKEITYYDVDNGLERQFYAMNKMYELLKSKNIKLSIILHPWPNQLLWDKKNSEYVIIWEKFCENKCNKIINLFPVYFKNKESLNRKEALNLIKKYYLPGDMHPNVYGNHLIANEFEKIYKKQ